MMPNMLYAFVLWCAMKALNQPSLNEAVKAVPGMQAVAKEGLESVDNVPTGLSQDALSAMSQNILKRCNSALVRVGNQTASAKL